MKRYIAAVSIVAILCGMLCGCDFWMDGQYASVTPYKDQSVHTEKVALEVSSASRIKDALIQMVEDGTKNGIISVIRFNSSTLHYYVESAIRYVMLETAIGGYAVSNINFEVGAKSEPATIALEIDYRHDHREILRLGHVSQMGEAADLIYKALSECEPSVAFRVDDYQETDFTETVETYGFANPDIVMEIPKVKTAVYPETGDERIVELIFTYKTGLEDLKYMQQQVEPIFTSVQLYVRQDAQSREKYAQIYTFLMERFDYTLQSSVTPAYALLIEGKGDCETFATVFASMCRKAKLECWVVSGARGGEPWTWNLINFDGGYHHVDLLRSSETGGFTATPSSAMLEYEWNYNAYPGK